MNVSTSELVDAMNAASRDGIIKVYEGARPAGGKSRGIGFEALSECWWKNGIIFVERIELTTVFVESDEEPYGRNNKHRADGWNVRKEEREETTQHIYALTQPDSSLRQPYRVVKRGIHYGRLEPEPEEGDKILVWENGEWVLENAGEMYGYIRRIAEDLVEEVRAAAKIRRSKEIDAQVFFNKLNKQRADKLKEVYSNGQVEKMEEERNDLRARLERELEAERSKR